METSLKDHPLTRYHGGHNERYYHRLQHSEVQLSRHSYQDSINKCVLRTMKTIIPIKNYPGDCWNLTKISYIGWLKFLKYACILNKKFAYRFHIYSALHEWVFIHTEVITGKLYAVKKSMIYLHTYPHQSTSWRIEFPCQKPDSKSKSNPHHGQNDQ